MSNSAPPATYARSFPRLDRPALASVQAPWGRPGDELWAEIYYQRELKWNRTMARCRVVEGPFFEPPRRRQVPAPDF